MWWRGYESRWGWESETLKDSSHPDPVSGKCAVALGATQEGRSLLQESGDQAACCASVARTSGAEDGTVHQFPQHYFQSPPIQDPLDPKSGVLNPIPKFQDWHPLFSLSFHF